MLNLDIATTALVMVDLQAGIVGYKLAPYSGAEVVANAAKLANRFREKGGLVVWIRVDFGPDNVLMPNPTLENAAPHVNRPAGWTTLVPELGVRDDEIIVTKHQWGGFYNTDLDAQLRRRGIRTLVMGGIGPHGIAPVLYPSAFERCYDQVLVEDAMTSFSAEMHQFPVQHLFPRFARIRSTAQVLEALA